VHNTQSDKQVYDGNLLSPLPVVLVGAVVQGRPNYLVIGYSSPFNFGQHIFLSLYKHRYTRAGILEHQTFSVNIPTIDLLAETTVCGSQSGRTRDKSTLFDTFYGVLKTAPMIRQCPINMECRVVETLDYDQNEGVIGRVIKSYVDPACLSEGALDWRKVQPILWATGGDNHYYQLGARIES
jgi:flavin reductase (DIM6/NTAB) family NADH-FMN oxidoreductase RutF